MDREAEKNKYRMALFFTWDVSLALWQETGLLQREVRIYEELRDKGVEIVFLTWGGAEDVEIAKTLAGIEVVPLYNYLPRPDNKVLRAFCSLLVPWKLRDVLKGCDIYKTNQMWGGWCAAISKIIFRKKMIARCGYELYVFTMKQGHGFLRSFFVSMISWFTYNTADHICVGTVSDARDVVKYFKMPKAKISIHPNWIETSVFVPKDVPKKENSILYVGRLNKQKNLRQLIKAVAGTPWELDIVGEGELREELEKTAKDLGANVNFLGSVPNDQLPDIYNAYPVFVLPSHYEGNPKTLLEAMSCGCAVLGSRVSGIETIIEPGVSGALCGTKAASIREGLENLMGKPALRERLGEGARQQILQKHTLDNLVRRELALYDSLMEGR